MIPEFYSLCHWICFLNNIDLTIDFFAKTNILVQIIYLSMQSEMFFIKK